MAYEIVKLNSSYTAIDTRDNLLGDGDRINMLRVEAVTQPGNTGSDLVELDTLLAAICGPISFLCRVSTRRCMHLPRFLTNMATVTRHRVMHDDCGMDF